jgi:LysR family glycine cleavage system transcriptional activator
MRSIPPLSAVRAFESAARHENFTRAAAELGMTQAAVSYQIRLLEERLGALLFHRSKGRVTLTEAGRKAAPLVSSAFDSLSDAFTAVREDDQGVLSINTAPTFASTWLAARLGSFQVAHPTLAVRLATENRLVDFAAEDVDVAIRIGAGGWAGLAEHFLFRSHVTPICSPSFRDRHALDHPDRLLEVPRLSPQDRWWASWLEQVGVSASEALAAPGVALDTQVMEANAAMAGHGIAMMTPLFWSAEIADGRLAQPFPQLLFPGSSYWLVYPEHKRTSRKIKAFREWLKAELRASAAEATSAVFITPEA